MNMKYINIFLLLFFCCSCTPAELPRDTLVFSCIKCTGCVVDALRYVDNRELDKSYDIVLDTSCYEEQMEVVRTIRFRHMESSQIENEFGRFGNFILFDSVGHKTEFMTDMHLRDFIR